MSETFPNLRSFQEKTLARLRPILKDPGLRIKVKHVIGGGPQDEWASCELGAEAECVDGMFASNLPISQSSMFEFACLCLCAGV